MKANVKTLTSASNILLDLLDNSEEKLARCLLQHTYFIAPEALRTKGLVCFPAFVRSSREHHKGKQRGEWSEWNGQRVRVCDNTKARLAFAKFTGLVMAGNKDGRIRGYHVAHVWEHVYDPAYFTAGWNLCLMPGFLKLFTEQQDCIPRLQRVVRQAAYDLYFKSRALGIDPPEFVRAPGIDLSGEFPNLNINVL